MTEHNIQPYRIYNAHEFGIACLHKSIKLVAMKLKLVVSSVTNAEKGKTTTSVLGGIPLEFHSTYDDFRRKKKDVSHAD